MSSPATPRSTLLLGFVLYVVVVGALPPQAVFWDGIGFLEWARELQLDYGHLSYVPLLRIAQWLLSPLADSEEHVGKLLSTLGAGLAFVLLWARLDRGGLRGTGAFTVSALFATMPIFWRQAGILEPTTLTIAALLVAAREAERYGEARTLAGAIRLCLALAFLGSLHVVSACALPWLVLLARGPAPRPPARHALVPLAFLLAALVLGAAAGKLPELGTFFGYWLGFLPSASTESLGAHVSTLGRIVREGYPLVALPAVIALVALLAARRAVPRDLWLGVPYALAFLLLGVPIVGLLVPVGLSLALVLAAGLAALPERPPARVATAAVIPLLLAVQLGSGIVVSLNRALTPDEEQEKAVLLAGALPKDAVLIAGPVAHHLRWFTGAPVIALPNEIHSAPGEAAGTRDPVAITRTVAQRAASTHGEVWISSEALDYLSWRFGADPTQLEVDAARAILVRAEPPLYLVPVLLPGPPER